MRTAAAWAVAVALAWTPTYAAAATDPPPDPKANPTPDDIDQARGLFENGEDLYADGSYDAAIAAFRRAFQLSAEPNCLYNIALAHDRLDAYDDAIEYLQYYRAYRPDSEHEALQERIDALQGRKAVAEREEAQRREAEEREAAAAAEQTPPPVPRNDKPKGRLFSPAAIVTASVAVVGFGVGAGLGITSLRRKDEAVNGCASDPDGDLFCSGGAEASLDSSRRFALGADIAIGIGAAAAVATIVIVAINASRRNKAGRTALSPSLRGAAMSVRF